MEHPFFTATTTRAEALRWLTISEKLLSARDLTGSKSFAHRAKDSDPTLTPADEILTVVDTLLAGDRRIANNQPDLYSILRLTPQQGRDSELVANQYRTLAISLSPGNNKFPFADQAFRLVVDAWSVLSNPSRKSVYDNEVNAFCLQDGGGDRLSEQNFIFFGGNQYNAGQVEQQQQPVGVSSGTSRVHQNFMSFSSGSNFPFGLNSSSHNNNESYSNFGSNVVTSNENVTSGSNTKQKQQQQNYFNVTDNNANVNVNVSGGNVGGGEGVGRFNVGQEEEERVDGGGGNENDGKKTFWTACPYCYYMYEYPGEYVDCTLRCQNCKRAFQGVGVSKPPPNVEGVDGYFCCWGFIPLGFSVDNWAKNRGAGAAWTPFSPMFTCPRRENSSVKRRVGKRKSSAPRVYVDDDEVFLEISGSESDDDWRADKEKKKQSKTRNVKGKEHAGTPNKSAKKTRVDKGKNVTVQDSIVVSPSAVEVANKTINEQVAMAGNGRKQPGRVAKNFGKLDLNVEFSNEAEEPAVPRMNQVNGPGRGEDDNIEGIGFFEGLDEFLNSLPILNVVGEDKVVKAA